ncbi:MAG: hypothetical protein KDK07_07955 [Bauldia sp.]|nr:hypothetical protein [Bauldia sp.]
MATVVKPFNTVNRRFAPGAEVSAEDVAPRSLGELAKAGLVASGAPARAETSTGRPSPRVPGRKPR